MTELPPEHVIAQALSHPLRARALAILAERTATPKELAQELGAPLPHMSYHIRTLAELGVIRLAPARSDRPPLPRHGASAGRDGAAVGLSRDALLFH